jgi:CHAD domain-containing protein
VRTSFFHPERQASTVAVVLSASGFEVGPPTPSSRTVLDTFDGRLHSSGLRLEAHGPDTELVLWSEDAAPPARLAQTAVPTWPSELPAGPFRARLAAITGERALLPLLSVESRVRTARRVDRRGKTTVVVDLHDELAVAGDVSADVPDWLAEVIPVAGHADAADAAGDRLRSLGLHARVGDLMAVTAYAAGVSISGYDSSPTVPLHPDEEAIRAFRRVLTNLGSTIDANLDGTIHDVDPEFLHELRVAVRRTRSVVAQGKGVLPPDVRDTYREGFGWLGEITGPPRDLDVYILGWESYTAPLGAAERASLEPVKTALETRRRAAHDRLTEALRSTEARGLLDGWTQWLVEVDVAAEEVLRIGPVVVERIKKAQNKVLRDGRTITPETPAERLHDLRKDTKKLRYLLECFGGLFPPKPRKAFVRRLKELQDNLGEHQDAEIHLAELRALAHDLNAAGGVDTDVLLAMGRLSDHLERRRQQERGDFAERFAAYDSKRTRQALSELLDAGSSS